eukprot:CAMPEP_0197743718 /NCGR_PEP_ID=MMETSP1435-20131217/36098_1 /TAXON_ID=426625 /ORGANISM="Chaetoceros brevis, Strain CCMP164" /LENGTH=120 /DNA_ID=CAMNT_0043334771 /DNA_START=382 /DNA_END=745 /DNA_ORIENTATION=+
MAGGALGSFVNATTTGKNEVHQMHEIFEIGKHDHRTPYQEAYDNAKNEGEDSNSRKKRILSRRKTMSQRLSEQTGLSDVTVEFGSTKRCKVKKELVDQRDKLQVLNVWERNDSHGGKWIE